MRVLFVDTPPTLDWSPASNFTKGGRRFPALSVTGEITYVDCGFSNVAAGLE